MRSPPVVVSVGSRGDSSFEADANANTGAIPHTFDPFLAPALDRAMKERVPYLHFHSIGLTGAQPGGGRQQTPRVQWASLQGAPQSGGDRLRQCLQDRLRGPPLRSLDPTLPRYARTRAEVLA